MNARTVLYVFVGLLVACALVIFASQLSTGSGSGPADLVAAQRKTPLLWVVDVCAAGLVAGSWWHAVMLSRFQQFTEHQSLQHHDQLNSMIERTIELEQMNDNYADRIEQLELELDRQTRDLIDQIATLEAASKACRPDLALFTDQIALSHGPAPDATA